MKVFLFAVMAACAQAQSVEQWIESAKSNDPEAQIKATDALVDQYLPGYLKTGLSGMLSKAGT